jgi:cell shape-determining protein MreD
MMKRTIMVGGIFIGALVQLFLPPWSVFGGAKPPVLAAFVLYYALRLSWRDMWVALFWAALLHDGLDLGPFGPALLAFPIIGVLAHRIRSEIFVDGAVTHMIVGSGVLGMVTLPLVSLTMNKLEAVLPKRRGYGWQ